MKAILEQIKPETVELLEKQAAKFGLSVDDYLRRLLPTDEQNLALKDDKFEAHMKSFSEGTENLPENNRNLFKRRNLCRRFNGRKRNQTTKINRVDNVAPQRISAESMLRSTAIKSSELVKGTATRSNLRCKPDTKRRL